MSFASQHVVDERWTIQHIQVVVGTRQSKKRMSYVQPTISRGLQNDELLPIFVPKIPLSSHRTILPFVMHTIKWGKHARKSTININYQLFIEIDTCRLPHMISLKLSPNCKARSLHRYHRGGFTSPVIFVCSIGTQPTTSSKRMWHDEGDNPKNPHASIFWTKYSSLAQTLSNMVKIMTVAYGIGGEKSLSHTLVHLQNNQTSCGHASHVYACQCWAIFLEVIHV